MELRDAPMISALPPDIDAICADAWPRRPFPIQGPGQRNVVQVVIKRSALSAVRAHGLSRTDVEVCGVLVGGCYQDDRGPYLYVESVIRGEYAENQLAQVTFTARTWSYIHEELDQHHAGKRILGWYHTHPGFGIFLSAMDLFIHENFFNTSEQLALVYDPLAREDGLFVWRHGKAERYSYLIQEDAPSDNPDHEALALQDGETIAAGAGLPGLHERLQRLERHQLRLICGLAAIGLIAIVWPILFVWWNVPARLKTKETDDVSHLQRTIEPPLEKMLRQGRQGDPLRDHLSSESTEESNPIRLPQEPSSPQEHQPERISSHNTIPKANVEEETGPPLDAGTSLSGTQESPPDKPAPRSPGPDRRN